MITADDPIYRLMPEQPRFRDRCRLTPTEYEILQGLGNGVSTRDIAAGRSCSVKSVETHVMNIKRKLGVESINQIRVMAAKHIVLSL